MREWAKRHEAAILCVCYSLAMDCLDLASTWLCKRNPLTEEQNPFMRDTAYNFLLWHAVGVKAIAFVLLMAFALVAYQVVKPFSQRLASFAVAALFLAAGVQLSNVVLHNILYGLGWFRP